jgi:hypothetical protein
VITGPRDDDAGESSGPSGASSPGPSDAARSTPLPKLMRNGEVPSPDEVIVQTEMGDFAIVDLASGSIGGPLTGARYGSALQVRADGLVCLCLSESGSVRGNPTKATVELVRFDAAGKAIRSQDIASFDGEPDPRDEGVPLAEQPHVLTAMGFSEADRFGFVGWSYRAPPVWRSGLLVVDLQSGEIVSRRDLPDVTAGDGDSRRVLHPPQVVGSTGADGLVIGRSWYDVTPVGRAEATWTFDAEAFRVGYPGGSLAEPAAVPGMAGCGDTVRFGGARVDGGTWVVCTRGGAFETRLRRVAGDGSSLPEVVVPGEEGIDGDATAISRDGSTLFAWDPAATTLTRVDIASGEMTTGSGLVARHDAGPLAALGRWIAPVAAAKSLLRSSVVLSPDGSRVYAIGVRPGVENSDMVGSAGVFVFDAATLELVEVYEPTADFVSLAIGPDGRFVYAAGMPRVDALGRSRPDQAASITVFDTADGSARLIAGQLGGGLITFGPEPFR